MSTHHLALRSRQAEQHLKFFGLEGMGGKYPSQLSGGQRQRAALLRTYLFSGQMLLLDEPFSALDAITKSAIHDWYLDMVRQMEASTLLITHDIDEAIILGTRIGVMEAGPASSLKEVISIDESIGHDRRHPQFMEYYRIINGMIEEEVNKTLLREQSALSRAS